MKRLAATLVACTTAVLLVASPAAAVAAPAGGGLQAGRQAANCNVARTVPAPPLRSAAKPPAEPLVPVSTGVFSPSHQLGIQVGAEFLPMAAQPSHSLCPALQVVTLSRGNLAVKSATTYVCQVFLHIGSVLHCPDALRHIADTLTHPDPHTLVVAQSNTSGWWPELQGYLRGIGMQQMPRRPGEGSIAALGVPGTPPGQGQQSLVSGSFGVPLRGYLYPSVVPHQSNDLYAYISKDYPLVDTRAAGSDPTANVITVSGTSYPSHLEVGGGRNGGFHIVILDRQTLRLELGRLFVTSVHHLPVDGAVDAATAALSRVGEGDIAIVSSVGDPFPAGGPVGSHWDALARQIARLGGTAQPFLERQDHQAYSLVGFSGSRPASSPESSTAVDGPMGGRLRVVLVRDHLQRFGVDLSDVTGTQSLNLYGLAFSPPTAWPATNDAARQRAYVALSRIAGSGSGDIRRDYWSRSDGVNWSNVLDKIRGASYPPHADYSQADFDAVKAELATEVRDLIDVFGYFNGTTATLAKAYIGNQQLLNEVSLNVQKQFSVSGDGQVGFNVATMLSSMLLVGHMFIQNTPMGKMAATINLGLAAVRAVQGTPVDRLSTKVNQLGTAIVARYKDIQRGTDQLRGWIVGDWGRLSTVASLVNCQSPGETQDECRQWQPTGNDRIRQENALTESLRQDIYQQLLGEKLVAYRLPSTQGKRQVRQPNDYVCGSRVARPPFGSPGKWTWTRFADDSAAPHVFVAAIKDTHYNYPGQSAMHTLFGTPEVNNPTTGPLGLYPPYFYLRALQVVPQRADC